MRHVVDLYVMSPDGNKHGSTHAEVFGTYCRGFPATRDDPGEPEGWDVERLRVVVNQDVKLCLDKWSVCLQVPGQKRVEVEFTACEVLRGFADVDDVDLCENANRYMLEG